MTRILALALLAASPLAAQPERVPFADALAQIEGIEVEASGWIGMIAGSPHFEVAGTGEVLMADLAVARDVFERVEACGIPNYQGPPPCAASVTGVLRVRFGQLGILVDGVTFQ